MPDRDQVLQTDDARVARRRESSRPAIEPTSSAAMDVNALVSPKFEGTANTVLRAQAARRLQSTHGNSFIQRLVDSAHQQERDEETARALLPEINAARGGGRPLNDQTRKEMGTTFGYDFSDVRIHADTRAHMLSRNLGANAFTVGRDVFFSEGAFSPGTGSGQATLLHELAHVAQNKTARTPTTILSDFDDPCEQEARGYEYLRSPNHASPPATAMSSLVAAQRAPTTANPRGVRPTGPPTHTRDGGGIPIEHRRLETIAHEWAYAGPDHELAYEWGYLCSSRSGHAGFQILTCRPRANSQARPILAFRGTEPTELEDILTDLDQAGIGVYQWYQNRALVASTLERLATSGPIIVTGHSLGGALAQITEANHADLVAQVVTFQSPGIPRALVESGALRRRAVATHYRVMGDLVHLAGESYTPGEIVEFPFPYSPIVFTILGQFSAPLIAHRSFPVREGRRPTSRARTQTEGGTRPLEVVRQSVARPGSPRDVFSYYGMIQSIIENARTQQASERARIQRQQSRTDATTAQSGDAWRIYIACNELSADMSPLLSHMEESDSSLDDVYEAYWGLRALMRELLATEVQAITAAQRQRYRRHSAQWESYRRRVIADHQATAQVQLARWTSETERMQIEMLYLYRDREMAGENPAEAKLRATGETLQVVAGKVLALLNKIANARATAEGREVSQAVRLSRKIKDVTEKAIEVATVLHAWTASRRWRGQTSASLQALTNAWDTLELGLEWFELHRYLPFYGHIGAALHSIASVWGRIERSQQAANTTMWEAAGEFVYPAAEPGGDRILTYLTAVFNAPDPSRIRTSRSDFDHIVEFFEDRRELLAAAATQVMGRRGPPTESSWLFFRQLDPDGLTEWVFQNREMVWRLIYGRRSLPRPRESGRHGHT